MVGFGFESRQKKTVVQIKNKLRPNVTKPAIALFYLCWKFGEEKNSRREDPRHDLQISRPVL